MPSPKLQPFVVQMILLEDEKLYYILGENILQTTYLTKKELMSRMLKQLKIQQ